MTMTANLADGRVLKFPDGTDPAIIQATVKRMIGGQDVAPAGRPDSDISGGVADTLDAGQQAAPEFAGSGVVEPLATAVTGAIAEPIAGIAGTLQAINPFAEEGAGARAVEATREALTFQPRTEAGQESLQAVGEVLAPVTEAIGAAESFLGDRTFEATGSAALAAAAKSIPTVIGEVLGISSAKGGVKAAQRARNAAKQGKITREITEAAPSIEQLKDTSRAIYREIDDAGITLKSGAFNDLTSRIERSVNKAGLDRDVTPKAAKALARFQELRGADVPLSEVDNLRTVAQNAAKSLEPAESALGSKIVEITDEFLDQAGTRALKGDPADVKALGKNYKAARDLWGRARRSELIEESFEKARNQASGFENGIRVQFRSILNNKKKRRFFNKDELSSMRRVVEGGKAENFAKLVGRLGFSEGGATNILGGLSGVALGTAAGGAVGAVLVPAIGTVSRKLAQRMTARGAEFADQVIRSGSNARKITEAYIRNTPKALRSPQELSELLMSQDIDLSSFAASDLARQAAEIATQGRAELAGALAAGQSQQEAQ